MATREAINLAVAISAPIIVVLCLDTIYRFWDWEAIGDFESASATIRNIGLVVGGVLALGLALWRSHTADRQARVAEGEARRAEREALDGRFQNAAALLADSKPYVRSAGVMGLYELGFRHRRYADQARVLLRNFCEQRRKEEPDAPMVTIRTARKPDDERQGPADAALAEDSAEGLDQLFDSPRV